MLSDVSLDGAHQNGASNAHNNCHGGHVSETTNNNESSNEYKTERLEPPSDAINNKNNNVINNNINNNNTNNNNVIETTDNNVEDKNSHSVKQPKVELKQVNGANNKSNSKNNNSSSNTGGHSHEASSIPPCVRPMNSMADLLHIEQYPNGGGYSLHAYHEQISRLGTRAEVHTFVDRFFKVLFQERRRGASKHSSSFAATASCSSFSNFCIGIIHGGAGPIITSSSASTSAASSAREQLPELVNLMATLYPGMLVKMAALDSKNTVTSCSMAEWARGMFASYRNGLSRQGPLQAVSLVGRKGEETGSVCHQLLTMLEKIPYLRPMMPWGRLSLLHGMPPAQSNDGPILWARPGEQVLPSSTNSNASAANPKKRKMMAMTSQQSGGAQQKQMRGGGGGAMTHLPITLRGASQSRETLIPDRTPCHADHADDGLERHTTAAVAVLKAVLPPPPPATATTATGGGGGGLGASRARILKEAVLFDPRHYLELIQRLQLDIMEPPASQCGTYWAEDAELNGLRLEDFRYVKVRLRDNDIYFIPRNVVHQFKTVSACTSIAWHTRLAAYYATPNQARVEPPQKTSTTHAQSQSQSDVMTINQQITSSSLSSAAPQSSAQLGAPPPSNAVSFSNAPQSSHSSSSISEMREICNENPQTQISSQTKEEAETTTTTSSSVMEPPLNSL